MGAVRSVGYIRCQILAGDRIWFRSGFEEMGIEAGQIQQLKLRIDLS